MADLQETTPQEPDAAASAEEGRTALRVRRGAPLWTVLLLFALALIALVWSIAIGFGWAAWLVLAGILVVVVGVIIAVNPRRGSPAGGTERH